MPRACTSRKRSTFFKDVFVWAYERSAVRATSPSVKSLGEPDPFRLRYRTQLREIIAGLVRAPVGRKDTAARIAAWSSAAIDPADRQQFNDVVETELASLQRGKFRPLSDQVVGIRRMARGVGGGMSSPASANPSTPANSMNSPSSAIAVSPRLPMAPCARRQRDPGRRQRR